jgi:hypothetical protein
VVGRQDEITRREFFEADHFHVGNDVHNETDNGTKRGVFHGSDFNAETRFIGKTGF